ncbi:hypothetical protein E2C01_021639 [Portunus trituberculatus]|uniref:Uncharacterized protein n=1 Tax=Portunus trituberculatus TaxID=210409 RepID=A0A5B7E583_PORTR|nr:hypothetical protein [Portunus trituberculatus]
MELLVQLEELSNIFLIHLKICTLFFISGFNMLDLLQCMISFPDNSFKTGHYSCWDATRLIVED